VIIEHHIHIVLLMSATLIIEPEMSPYTNRGVYVYWIKPQMCNNLTCKNVLYLLSIHKHSLLERCLCMMSICTTGCNSYS
jgi:hypothetical protein